VKAEVKKQLEPKPADSVSAPKQEEE